MPTQSRGRATLVAWLYDPTAASIFVDVSCKLLMVDEPSEGLMPANVELITHALLDATKTGLTVLVVDSSFDLLRQLCSRLYAMDRGVLIGMYRPSDFSGPDQMAATILGEA